MSIYKPYHWLLGLFSNTLLWTKRSNCNFRSGGVRDQRFPQGEGGGLGSGVGDWAVGRGLGSVGDWAVGRGLGSGEGDCAAVRWTWQRFGGGGGGGCIGAPQN